MFMLLFLLQNIAPTHVKDIVVFIDAITIVFEEASKGGAPLSLPIASIEVGHGHSLPNLALRYIKHSAHDRPAISALHVNLNQNIISAIRYLFPSENNILTSFRCKISKQNISVCFGDHNFIFLTHKFLVFIPKIHCCVLVIKDVTIVLNILHYLLFCRRGEEHSFILKPATLSSRERNTNGDAPLALSLLTMTESSSNTHTLKVGEPYVALGDQYAVLVSYRCNYTGKFLIKEIDSSKQGQSKISDS